MNPFVARLKDKFFRRRFREFTHFTSWGEVTGVMSKENPFESRDFFGGENWEECEFFLLCGSCCRWAECRQVLYVIPWGVPSKIIMEEEIWFWKSNIYNKLGTIGSVSLKKSWKWKIGPSRQSLPQKLGAVCVFFSDSKFDNPTRFKIMMTFRCRFVSFRLWFPYVSSIPLTVVIRIM